MSAHSPVKPKEEQAHSPLKPKEEQVYADACIAPPASFEGDGEGEGDVEIEPLSGKPFFHVPMAKSHVCSPYQLVLHFACV